jgi:Homeodomain-like domain
MRKAALIELNDEERQALQQLAKARSSKGHEARRARALLLAAQGRTNLHISDEVGLHYNAIAKTRARFVHERLGALQDLAPQRAQTHHRRPGQGPDFERSDPTPARLGSLERALHGRPPGRLEGHRAAALGQKRPQTAPDQSL